MAERRSANETRARDAGRSPARRRADGDTDGHVPDSRRRRPSPGAIARRAADQLAELTGCEQESVVALERTEKGWCVRVEVVELRRIPDTADILAEYTVDVDERGALVGCRRTSRHTRARTGEER